MLKRRIIPCLDIKNGRVVKGVNFNDLIDAGDPVAQAEFYYKNGADEICLLDITATHEKQDLKFDIIQNVSKTCFVPLAIGGGIKDTSDITKLLSCGADKVSINSSAVKNPNLIKQSANKFGCQCIIVAIDAKKNPITGKYEVYVNGGRKNTKIDAISWAVEAESLGAGELLLTSMDKDGTKSGYDIELINIINKNVNIPIIASGGVGTLEHLHEGVSSGADAVLAASIFHFKEHDVIMAKKFLQKKGVAVRI
ncbi:imidazole glycerol phosphate synthase subunit HisF [Flavobacteriaceae bacterium]|nr:imidazole glycerol phosphate synthase subunit HisF [Flavobacteriaceae bacterium]